jgi:outer membrane protein assembly factor BamC
VSNSAAPTPASTPAADQLVTVNVQLKDTAAGKVIQINEPFDRSWRRVGLALDSGHIVTVDKDRSKGIYFVSAVQDKDKKKQHTDYQVTVRESSGGSEVVVVDQNGKSDSETARITDMLYGTLVSNLNQDGKPAGDKSGSRSGDAVRTTR